jgi:mannose-6-phosphate isomerase-like protein (cupin superfamily)
MIKLRRSILPSCLLVGAVSAPADGQDVTHLDAATVRTAFEKGSVLVDGAGGNFMVHASRRDSAGQCEIHTRDADVIYVLEGSATFVIGGTCPDAKSTGPDEMRGSAIEGGQTRQLGKGDVIVVPRDTPHWFKEVDGPVLYYVVKVR